MDVKSNLDSLSFAIIDKKKRLCKGVVEVVQLLC